MTELASLQQQIEKSDAYKGYKEKNPDAYLAHAFVMVKGGEEWQLGYYDSATKDVTTFDATGKIVGSDKALGADGDLTELDLALVRVSFSDAMAAVDELMKDSYKARLITQRICVLQHLEQQLWNITLVTNAFSTINIRIDAASGKVLRHKEQSLMSMARVLPGEKKE